MEPVIPTGGPKPRSDRRRLRLRALLPLLLGVAGFFATQWLVPSHPFVSSYSRADYDRAVSRVESKRGDERYDALAAAAKTSVYFGSLDEARAYATELLEFARTTEGITWNLGNALHDGHEVLGLVALRLGHTDEAAKELLLAGETPGSPQADTFGPNMLLAKELLEHGDRSTVIAYFNLCRRFWEMERGRLDQWTKDASEGNVPDFGANLVF